MLPVTQRISTTKGESFMQRRILSVALMAVPICCLIYAGSAAARGISAVELNLIPTAETVGKGGYSLSVGAFSYDLKKHTGEPMEIDVDGLFKEKHDVELRSDIWLTPIRITYGISDRLDLTFGTTYSVGDTDKVISDYYETGNDGIERIYPQVVLGGVLGMKYIMREASAGVPSLAIGGEVQAGYTVDEELVDETPRNSFPFVGVQLYVSTSYDVEVASIHGGAGIFLSSKSIESDDKYELPLQAGIEIPFDGFAAVVDVTLSRTLSGIDLGTVVSGGLRYDISPRAALNATVASGGVFLVRLTVSGRKPVTATPPARPIIF